MSLHPLIDLVNDRDVKQSKGFRLAAERLTGPALESAYQVEVANAPRRSAEGLPYLGVRVGRKAKGRQHGRDEKHLAEAIARSAATAGDPEAETSSVLELPAGEDVLIVDALVPIRTGVPDKEAAADPHAGVEDVPLLALIGDDRLAVGVIKHLEPDSNRAGAGDTPLRLMLQGLAHAAAVDANRDALREEIEKATGKRTGEEAPAVIIAASRRYWELCRKREAQKGAAWIRELERLAREAGESIGVEFFFVTLETASQPGWEYDDEGPRLSSPIRFESAWETGAGKLKPKPKAKKTDPANEIVEADYDRPVKRYSIRDTYSSGDRIDHPKLGEGVVQAITGRGKIEVLFGEEKKLLVHERD